MALLDLRHNANFRDNYLLPAMKAGFLEILHIQIQDVNNIAYFLMDSRQQNRNLRD